MEPILYQLGRKEGEADKRNRPISLEPKRVIPTLEIKSFSITIALYLSDDDSIHTLFKR